MIVRDGSNLAPAEIEEVALREPGVRAAAAVGVPDPPHGDAVHLFVAPASEERDDLEARLWTRLKESLRALAVPSALHLVADLPINAAGKVDKKGLRERVAG
jgi:acyl-coenzyme A synthetase/AMP-(fatty) acid ligase